MTALAGFLPLLFFFAAFAACIKFAAFLLHRSRVRWLHAFVYVLGLVAITVVVRLALASTGIELPPLVALPVGLVVHLAFGGWYFASRLRAADGVAAGHVRALQLSGIVFAVLLALGTAGSYIASLVLAD